MGYAVVVDANVVISSLINPMGPTMRRFIHVKKFCSVYVPDIFVDEVARYLEYVAKKRNVDVSIVSELFRIFMRGVTVVSEKLYLPYKAEALSFVHDPEDAPYVALALHLREKHDSVTILTFNAKDYKTGELKKKGITVLSPDQI